MSADAREEGPVGPPLRRDRRRRRPRRAAVPGQEPEPQRADHEERQVGDHVEEVRNAEERALIGEVVVRGILGDGGTRAVTPTMRMPSATSSHARRRETSTVSPDAVIRLAMIRAPACARAAQAPSARAAGLTARHRPRGLYRPALHGTIEPVVDADRFVRELPRLFARYPRSEHPRDRRFAPILEDVGGLAKENNLALLNLAASLLAPERATSRSAPSRGSASSRRCSGTPATSSGSTTSRWATAPGQLEANLRRHGLGGHTILEGDAFGLLGGGALGDRRVGVYYYDAAHDYRSQVRGLRLIEPYLADDALLIVDDTDWEQVARAIRDYLAGQPRAELVVTLDGKDLGQPWWWEGVQVLRWRAGPSRAAAPEAAGPTNGQRIARLAGQRGFALLDPPKRSAVRSQWSCGARDLRDLLAVKMKPGRGGVRAAYRNRHRVGPMVRGGKGGHMPKGSVAAWTLLMSLVIGLPEIATLADAQDVQPIRVISEQTIKGFAFPEAVTYDPQAKLLYVSEFGSELKPVEKDGKGRISRVSLTGEILDKQFLPAPGGEALNKPKGSWVAGNRFWVTDIDVVWVFDLQARRGRKVALPGAQFANDLAVMGKALYVSDNRGDQVYRVEPADFLEMSGEPQVTPVLQGKSVNPNGVYPAKDGSLLMVGFMSPEQSRGIYALSAGGEMKALATMLAAWTASMRWTMGPCWSRSGTRVAHPLERKGHRTPGEGLQGPGGLLCGSRGQRAAGRRP